MNAITAIWKNGQIVPSEPIDWPEGSRLLVEPLPEGEKIGLDDSEWENTPEALADWEAWIKTIEPLEYTKEELAEMERYHEEYRRFNLEAVRKQMGLEESS
jgi:hypothetical protein